MSNGIILTRDHASRFLPIFLAGFLRRCRKARSRAPVLEGDAAFPPVPKRDGPCLHKKKSISNLSGLQCLSNRIVDRPPSAEQGSKVWCRCRYKLLLVGYQDCVFLTAIISRFLGPVILISPWCKPDDCRPRAPKAHVKLISNGSAGGIPNKE
jgi:hypothetical protein